MYRNVVLTLLLVAATAIAIELAHSRPAPPPDDPDRLADADRAILERRIPQLKLDGMTVGQAVEKIAKMTGVPIAVNWVSLETVRDWKVDVDLRDVALGDALAFLLRLDRGDLTFYPYSQAEFDIVDGTLFIGTATALANPPTFPDGVMSLRVYDVRDLLTDAYWGYRTTRLTEAEAASRVGELTNMVKDYAGMKNYQWQSGSHGQEPSGAASISNIGGHLLVVQTAYGHIQVAAFLARLRAGSRGGR